MFLTYVDSDSFGIFVSRSYRGTARDPWSDRTPECQIGHIAPLFIAVPLEQYSTADSMENACPRENTERSPRAQGGSFDRSQPSFHVRTLSFNDDPTSSSAQDGPRCGSPTRPGDYICYKHVSFWSTTLMTTEAWVGNSFWTGTPVGTSSSIGQRVVVLETGAEGGGGGGGGGEITTSGSPARSQSNLQRIFSGWSPPK